MFVWIPDTTFPHSQSNRAELFAYQRQRGWDVPKLCQAVSFAITTDHGTPFARPELLRHVQEILRLRAAISRRTSPCFRFG